MKTLSSFALILLLQTSLLLAQTDNAPKEISVEDVTKTMSKGAQPGFRTELHQHNKKTATEALNKYLKEQGKIKAEAAGTELVTVGGVVKSISAKPLNLYFIMNEYEKSVELFAFFEMDSAFLTKEKNETEFLSARKFTRDFAVFAYKSAMQDEIDLEEKKLKELESDLNKIHKEHDNLEKKISQEKQNIDNTKEKISTCELDQERVRKQVQEQKEAVTKAKAGGNEVVIKEEEKKLKALESEVSKLQKQEDGCHKDITGSEASIRDHERAIATNRSDASLKQADIEKQRALMNELMKKRDAIL